MQTGKYDTLWDLLSAWIGAELNAEWQSSGSADELVQTLDKFDDLCYHLPRFGDPEQPWACLVEQETEPVSTYVLSNVSPHYYVNGRWVQFLGRSGRVTVVAS